MALGLLYFAFLLEYNSSCPSLRLAPIPHSYFMELLWTVITKLLPPININNLNRYGSWGVCFTYAGWFGIKGLVAAGRTYKNCSSIHKACDYLLSKELASGGWGESYLSCQDKVCDSMIFEISFIFLSRHRACSFPFDIVYL